MKKILTLLILLLVSCQRPEIQSETPVPETSLETATEMKEIHLLMEEVELRATLMEQLSDHEFSIMPHYDTAPDIDRIWLSDELLKQRVQVGDAVRLRGYLHEKVLTVSGIDRFYEEEPITGGSDGLESLTIEATIGQQVDEYDHALYDVNSDQTITSVRMTLLPEQKGWLPGDRVRILGVIQGDVIEAHRLELLHPILIIRKINKGDYVSLLGRVEEVTEDLLFVRDTHPVFLLPRATISGIQGLLPENLVKGDVVRIIGHFEKEEEDRILIQAERVERE